MTATLHADAKVEVREALATEEDDGLHSLELESLGLDELNGGACCVGDGTREVSVRFGSKIAVRRDGRGTYGAAEIVAPPHTQKGDERMSSAGTREARGSGVPDDATTRPDDRARRYVPHTLEMHLAGPAAAWTIARPSPDGRRAPRPRAAREP